MTCGGTRRSSSRTSGWSTCGRRYSTTPRGGTTPPASRSDAEPKPRPSRPTTSRSTATSPTTTPACATCTAATARDPATHATTGWASMAAKEVADQRHEDAKVQAVGEASSAAVAAYDKTLPDDGAGSASDLIQPKDIERFDAATFTWVGGNNYTDNPYVDVERCTANCGDPAHASYQPFADQSGEIPVIVHYPGGNASCGDPSCVPGTAQALTQGMVGYRLGGQVWKWTATFEAFVSGFPLVDLRGQTYQATPAGTYRFVVHGQMRRGGQTVDYNQVSNPFRVMPWTGITATNLRLDSAGHIAFSAGPR